MSLSATGFYRSILVAALLSVSLLVGLNVWIRHSAARIVETNSPPVVVDDSYTVHGSRVLTPLDNDYDPDNDLVSLYSVTQPQHGTANVASSTRISYTVAPGYVGSDSFTYTAKDNFGNFATATIHITAVNQSPVAVTDSYAVHWQAALTPKANDYDPDGDGVTLKTILTLPQHGTLNGYPSGVYVYTAAYGYVGPDSFTYTLQDDWGATATGTANIGWIASSKRIRRSPD